MISPTPETEVSVGRFGGLRARYEAQLSGLRSSDVAKAGGLAGAMIINNVIALGSTVVFARELSDYGALGALIAYFLILGVAGQALQVATAREGVLGHLGVGPGLTATLRSWGRTLAWFTVVLTVISVLLRQPIASAVGVKHDQWAAAIGLPAGCLWLGLSILRGALQGVGDYKTVGLSLINEQAVRLVSGALLAGIGLGVTGAYLGTPISFIAVGVYCARELRVYARRHVNEGPATASVPAITLWTHVRRAWAPIAGLVIVALLQNIDLIAAKHRFDTHTASSYAAVAVAAKVPIWVAMGAGFYLVPETSRRRAAGEDTRAVLARALGIIAVCAIPVLLIFAGGGHLLIKTVYGAKRLQAEHALLILALAFTILAATYLAVQYMLALKRTAFLIPLGAVAIAEPILLLQASHKPVQFATVVLFVQIVAAAVAFTMALRRSSAAPAVSPEPA